MLIYGKFMLSYHLKFLNNTTLAPFNTTIQNLDHVIVSVHFKVFVERGYPSQLFLFLSFYYYYFLFV
jgi:hypothetical protein